MAAEGQTQQELGPSGSTIATFESIQARATSVRRARPPDIVVGDADSAHLRPESRSQTVRISKRESRVGLRSILGLPKKGEEQNETDKVGAFASLRETSHAGVRASVSDISHWPYHSQSSRSELSLASLSPPSTSRSTFPGIHKQPSRSRFRNLNGGPGKLLPEALGSSPDLWTPSPLFQVYPQAIKQATLPACTTRSDTLLRRNGTRSGVLVGSDRASDEDSDRPKKLHQKRPASRHSLDWTTKTYVLVTSGYLLQYSSGGSFNRLPERILRLTRDSAAFASDLIPGRHWVIQVVSCMGADGAPASDARSLLSKLAHWASDKKSASSFLMVLESAEEMEEWLTVLRQEIENLGGKRQLSETGEPKPESKTNEQHSQRIMVLRDPERFSSLIPDDFSWSNEHALREPNHHSSSTHDVTSDDVSTAESHDSSDSQQFDSLRSSSNRLSCISQRTVVTSANSTPACSPTRQSFSSNPDEAKSLEAGAGIKLRPNAQDIVFRRKSMQIRVPKYEVPMDPRPHSAASSYADQQDVPNFSKRIQHEQASIPETETTLKSSRKPPPTALATARPLSTVMDLPSPKSPMTPLEPMPSLDIVRADPKPIQTSLQMERSDAAPVPQDEVKAAVQETSLRKHKRTPSASRRAEQEPQPYSQLTIRASRVAPRQSVSLANLRPRKDSLTDQPQFVLSSNTVASCRAQFEPLAGGHTKPEQENTPPFTTPSKQSASKSTSNTPHDQPRSCSHQAYTPSIETSLDSIHPPRNVPGKRQSLAPLLPSNAYLEAHAPGRCLTFHRSMPHLVEGPPLAPPPNRALPPIPKKR